MSGFSLPSNRTVGRALLVGSATCRAFPMQVLSAAGYQCGDADDPYSAMAELCRRPLVYRTVILSLSSLYQDELALITAIKRSYPHIEIYLSQTDGRPAALAEAMRLGADGLVSDEGVHRFNPRLDGPPRAASPDPMPRHRESAPSTPQAPAPSPAPREQTPQRGESDQPGESSFLEIPIGEAVLTADELRALLQEQPARASGIDEP